MALLPVQAFIILPVEKELPVGKDILCNSLHSCTPIGELAGESRGMVHTS